MKLLPDPDPAQQLHLGSGTESAEGCLGPQAIYGPTDGFSIRLKKLAQQGLALIVRPKQQQSALNQAGDDRSNQAGFSALSTKTLVFSSGCKS